MNVLRLLRARDANLSALRRAGRAAIVAPGLFALSDKVIGSPTVATFAAFGTFATLLFVDFGGSMRERLRAQVGLVLAGALLVCLGTLVSQVVWLAVLATFVAGLAVLFAGVVSSALAGATTALLVGFVLPVTQPGPLGSIPDELGGWFLAGATSVIAIAVLWPAPTREPLRLSAATACERLARRLRVDVDYVRAGFDPDRRPALDEAADEAQRAVATLRGSFFRTPYRPTGLSTATRTLLRLVEEVMWLDSVLVRMPLETPRAPTDPAVCELKLAAATVLERGAALLESGTGDPRELDPDLRRLARAREEMEQAVTSSLPIGSALVPTAPRENEAGEIGAAGKLGAAGELVTSLGPSFRAQQLSFAASAIAANVTLIVAANRRTWWQHLLGRRPDGVESPLSSARVRAGSHVERHSVWLHNSVRGAIALTLAVLVADVTGVQHSFWVVFGTLSVLRSNALNTGQNALRGLLGTVIGFVVGGVIIVAVGTNTAVFWVLLPPAIAFAGLAPAAISFAAGQAGFTAALLILYNIVAPAGWTIGLVRIEDVAIGCAVSLVAGALFWPRGAGSALGQALAEAFSDNARFLRDAVHYGLTRCDAQVPTAPVPEDASRRAAAASRRLDDAFRGYLAERGTKSIPLADLTALITGVSVLHFGATAILDIWQRNDASPAGDRGAARAQILDSATVLVNWYEQAARALAGSGTVPDELAHDGATDGRLVEAVRRDLTGEDGRATATAVRMIWTADHIDSARRLQAGILAPARAVATAQRTPRSWLAMRRTRPTMVLEEAA
ncbi:FUSC family protein [Rugosimonospora acidiphila]|uniref:FUSC family protein n=1 Tax=Rugosimonospora acidiphila TaxID=556531 RepID=UPI0031E62B72